MTRIVAGEARGRRLSVRPRPGLRPTSDRAREALFSTLAGLTDLAGARFLDLYAGTGAVGLEALSRGAGMAVLVESDARAARLVRDNIDAVGLPGARLAGSDVGHFLAGEPEPYDIVFADPPYSLVDAALQAVIATVAASWLAPGAVVVVERPTRGAAWQWREPLEPVKHRRYGEGTLWYGRRP